MPETASKFSFSFLDENRIKQYETQEGLFIVHSCKPSSKPGQAMDIRIWLHQHGRGPIDQVEKVVYQLGDMFPNSPYISTDRESSFAVEVSAYGPVLCHALICFKDSFKTLELPRYINLGV